MRWTLPSQAPRKIQTLQTASFSRNGAKLFNILPKALRNLTGCTVHTFKTKLDTFLQDIPDEPPVPGYTHLCRAPSNSIPDQLTLKRRDAGLGGSGGAPWL